MFHGGETLAEVKETGFSLIGNVMGIRLFMSSKNLLGFHVLYNISGHTKCTFRIKTEHPSNAWL